MRLPSLRSNLAASGCQSTGALLSGSWASGRGAGSLLVGGERAAEDALSIHVARIDGLVEVEGDLVPVGIHAVGRVIHGARDENFDLVVWRATEAVAAEGEVADRTQQH